MRVAGLDVSTRQIGYAPATEDEFLFSVSSRFGAKENIRRLDDLAAQFERLVRTHPPRPDVVVIEDYSLGMGKNTGILSKIRLGEIGGTIRRDLFRLDIAIVEVRPTTLKRFATGRGNADKAAMVAEARRRGAIVRNDDEADAWHLRRMGRAAYGLEVVAEDYERDALGVVTW